jgi:hypothetical protein
MKHHFVEVGYFVQDLVEIPTRYLPFLNLLIFGDISIFFVNISRGGARTAHPRVPNRITQKVICSFKPKI